MEYTGPQHVDGAPTVFMGCFMIVFILIGLALNIAMIVAFCKICSKAGYSWALGLLMLVPLANVILPLYLGFSTWPIERQSGGQSNYPPASPGTPPPNGNFRNL